MEVIIKLHGMLRTNQGDGHASGGLRVEYGLGATVGTLLDLLGIHDHKSCIVTMNHRVARVEEEVIDGTTLDIFQIVSGG
jgi:sulfur carrier protein ThiS